LGNYGLLVVGVSGRSREIGERLALGTSPAAVAGQIVEELGAPMDSRWA